MGGSGSTRWGWYSRRWTAEDCLKLSIFDLRRLFGASAFAERRDRSDFLLWRRRDGSLKSSVAYQLTWLPAAQITLRYTPGGASQAVTSTIKLQAAPCHYGSVRWWFTYPRCERRVGVLYYRQAVLMHGGEWACRHCHDLTYTSAQEAHVLDRGGSPYVAYVHVLSRLRKAQDLLKKHPRGREAQKAKRIYDETKPLLDRLRNAANAETSRRQAVIIAALEADESRSKKEGAR